MATLTTKIATLASFVILVGGFVAYRSGAFDSLRMASSSMHEYEEEQDTSRPDSTLVIPDNYINTSKSGVIFSGDIVPVEEGKKGKKKVRKVKKQKDISPIIIPSSKSGAIFSPENEGL